VHEDAVGDSFDCADAGAHYDPTNKEVAPYTCDPSTPDECYAGDMSGKHGAATVMGPVGVDRVLTVNELVGKSVVIYASNSESRVACGTINGGDAHEQVRPCGPEPPPSPLSMDASLCGERGNHHCYFGGSCMDIAPAVCQISGMSHDWLFVSNRSHIAPISSQRCATDPSVVFALRGSTLQHLRSSPL
jgi:hypothetical protein